jgi:hypothetical protein
MTLIEALESGLPYKRKMESYWYGVNEDPKFDIEDVLSTDWETKDKSEFTLNDVVRAIDTVRKYANPHDGWKWFEISDKAIKAAKESHE